MSETPTPTTPENSPSTSEENPPMDTYVPVTSYLTNDGQHLVLADGDNRLFCMCSSLMGLLNLPDEEISSNDCYPPFFLSYPIVPNELITYRVTKHPPSPYVRVYELNFLDSLPWVTYVWTIVRIPSTNEHRAYVIPFLNPSQTEWIKRELYAGIFGRLREEGLPNEITSLFIGQLTVSPDTYKFVCFTDLVWEDYDGAMHSIFETIIQTFLTTPSHLPTDMTVITFEQAHPNTMAIALNDDSVSQGTLYTVYQCLPAVANSRNTPLMVHSKIVALTELFERTGGLHYQTEIDRLNLIRESYLVTNPDILSIRF
jgi:hypothetical protein